ncbi:maleylpyruvate isomerase family mycothiol-dependent enzyme [Cryptosporangium sp. NPDC048952]|uniref:maleylpyruvate isomerase family mycothiol-dependent enzyme n=1 Tax=Cryptosporangium sp. NPDC048952 TaxID=3363961 RepID=UPI0037114E1A
MDYAAALVDQDRQFADMLRGADLSAPVPTCPGWTLTQLLRHLGRGHRWAAQMIREHSTEPIDPRAVEGGKPPADDEGALEWVAGGGQIVLDAVAAADADTRVWTAVGPRPASWWIRRRLHESTVHRADAAIALGAPYSLPADLAADGVTEWIELLVVEQQPLPDGVSLHLHATDVDAEWTVRGTAAGLTFEPSHSKATAAVRGPATELLLAITRRRSDPSLELFGDDTVWRTWLDNTPF